MKKMNVHLDMETGDPDDVMTLCFLLEHSRVNLRSVTVMPGTDEQTGLVRLILREAGLDIPVGSNKPGYDKNCVSPFYYRWFPKIKPLKPDDEGYKIIMESLEAYPDLVLLTGAPLKNFRKVEFSKPVSRWVAQGGFAGDNVVPAHLRLEKFIGRISCPTFNFNGDPETAMRLLETPFIEQRHLVSKNVCHGVVYNEEMHEQFKPFSQKSIGLNFVYKGMELYLKRHSGGKKFHDPLAAAVMIEPETCNFAPVRLFRNRGEWGSNYEEGSNTLISVEADEEMMVAVLTDSLWD
jgi:inosine-uridine nucleoside N-ribohydrolase